VETIVRFFYHRFNFQGAVNSVTELGGGDFPVEVCISGKPLMSNPYALGK
jgi:hypothetical protein